ncbi:MAG: transposase [Proteobacteria bacterium]|nr:MAG: transposase [Pseudomonadota bacterium]
MPRQPRLDVANIPQHVVQRGNDRQPCFFNEGDYVRYLLELREICLKEQCQVHAYVLMTNHAHLLITPQEAGRVAKLMQNLGRRYVGYINDRYRRTGTLWEGRYKSSLVDCDRHLLQCYRYIELNPVRAGMVEHPGDYPWSSYGYNAQGSTSPLVHPHPFYQSLGVTDAVRQERYRQWVMEAVEASETDAIRLNLQRQHALGSDRFRMTIEKQLARRAGPAKIGRPAKRPDTGKSAL